MLFNSVPYAIFLALVFVLHWLLPHRFRWIMLPVGVSFYTFQTMSYVIDV
jgi:D-alanyl-lipoteichoic acid acyltransferase DltB (MBOAT superfamily)